MKSSMTASLVAAVASQDVFLAPAAQEPPECSSCAAPESECCIHHDDNYPPQVTGVTCIDPTVDVCVDGHVCPASTPQGCYEHTCMWGSGDFNCYNPETHACMPTASYCENMLCPIDHVPCRGVCMPNSEGFCCNDQWHRNEENKQCCQGICQGSGCEFWTCDAAQTCVQPWEPEYKECPYPCSDMSYRCKDPALADPASRNSTGTIVGSGMEVDAALDAQGDACLKFLNGLRSNHGLSGMTLKSSQNSCAANQAKGDAASSAHAHFGACGEHGQCEAMGTHSCKDGIQMYYDEGPGGGHYKIIMGHYTQMAYGHCDNCGSYGTFWTMDFW